MSYVLPDISEAKLHCRACGEERHLEDFRLYKTEPEQRMDFCIKCEKLLGTLALYRRYTAYGTPEIIEAVYAASRIPKAKRTLEQDQVLYEPGESPAPAQTKEDLVQQELMRRELCRRRLVYFTTSMDKHYLPGWVHQDICRRLERFVRQVEAGESPRLMLAMPPRSGKSRLASDIFPSWVLGHHPEWSVIATSYAQSLPVSFSRNIRDRLSDPEYKAIFPNTTIRPDAKAVEEWRTTRGGGYKAAGVGVGLTGFGGNILIADDLLKDQEAASSETIRKNTFEWYQSVLRTRLAPGGGILCIGCLTGDTKVTLANSIRKEIKDIVPGDEVLSWDDGELVTRKVLNWADQGEDDIFEIRTGNAKVRANARHPFLIRSAKGHYKWVRVRDMQSLGINNCMVHSGVEPQEDTPPRINEDEAWALGFMFGDGWLTLRNGYNKCASGKKARRRAIVTCVAKSTYPELNSRICGFIADKFGANIKETDYGYYRTEKQTVGRWFQSHGLAGTAKTKRLPAWLFEQPLHVRRAFLDGFIDADGHVNRRNRVSISLCNEALVSDLRDLARSVGLKPSNVSVRTRISQAPHSKAPKKSVGANVQWQHHEYDEAPFYFRRIRSIKPAGRAVVYDIEVEGTGNFIADGVVSHNTRWHFHDPAGQLLEIDQELEKAGVPAWERENWEVVSYPAIAEHDEYLMQDGRIAFDIREEESGSAIKKLRNKGEALHPERYPVSELLKIKRNTAPSIWNALYQQNPVPEEGDFFKAEDFRDRWLDPAYRPLCRVFMAADYAIGKKQRNDFTVVGVFALDSNDDLYVLDIRRGRWGTLEIAQNIADLVEKHKPEIYAGEQGAIHHAVWPIVKQELDKKRFFISIDETLVPIQDKETRARPLQGRMQRHKLFFSYDTRERPEIYDIAQREMLQFPNGAHDDIVDMLAWGSRLALNISLPTDKAPPKRKSWEDTLNTLASGERTFMAA